MSAVVTPGVLTRRMCRQTGRYAAIGAFTPFATSTWYRAGSMPHEINWFRLNGGVRCDVSWIGTPRLVRTIAVLPMSYPLFPP